MVRILSCKKEAEFDIKMTAFQSPDPPWAVGSTLGCRPHTALNQAQAHRSIESSSSSPWLPLTPPPNYSLKSASAVCMQTTQNEADMSERLGVSLRLCGFVFSLAAGVELKCRRFTETLLLLMLGFSFNKFASNDYVHIRKFFNPRDGPLASYCWS